jgi:signal transduction histidine kinase/ligand-binding sensor domain-containing protein
MSTKARVAAMTVFLALLGVCATRPCFALDGARLLSQYGHTAWRVRDGDLPAPVYPVAQTKDGYLWVGSQAGLLRFDGVRFVPVAAPDGALSDAFIIALAAARDGSLWIGSNAGLARWFHNELTMVSDDTRPVGALLEDAQGTIWLARARRRGDPPTPPTICRVEGNAEHCFGKDEGLDFGAATCCIGAIVQEGDGTFLISTDQGVVRWKPGSPSVMAVMEAKVRSGIPGVLFLAMDLQKRVWVGMSGHGPEFGLLRYEQGKIVTFAEPFDGSAYGVQALFVDRGGALWIGTVDAGIYRVQGDRIDQFKAADGLSSDCVYWFYEDREGTVWVTTSEGLDRFRDVAVVTYSKREGLTVDEVDGVLATRDGRVWIGSSAALDVFDGRAFSAIRAAEGLPGQQVTSLLQDHTGAVWVGIDNTLSIYENGRFVPVAGLDGKPIGFVFGLIEDADHDVWAKVAKKVVRIRDRVALEEMPSDGARFAADPESGIWKGLAQGGLARYRNGAWENVEFENSATTSRVALSADGTVWGSSEKGLIALKNGERRRIDAAHGLPCTVIHDFVADADDGLWLYARCGVIHIAAADWKAWWKTPEAALKTQLLDAYDGARPGRAPFNAATRSPDGRLWFASGVILQMIDPAKLAKPRLPLPVHVEALFADRKPYAAGHDVVLPPNPRDIQIDYTALDLAVPQKLRFRYRLEGFDEQWQEPGARRQAFYNDLAPGSYAFHVSASRGDGLWSEDDTALKFVVAAAWYQTAWFRFACLALLMLALVGGYRWRVRRIARALHARFDERLAERTRLARDLHDTLLQTIQGSKMVADDALDEAADFDRLRQAMQRLSAWLGKAVDEGRKALNALRTSATQTNDLAESFRRASQDCRPNDAMDVHFSVEGACVEMHPIVRDEVYRIGYEAIRNACAHSRASRVNVHLVYAKDHLALRIDDDGMGFDAQAAAKSGHFGLQGMRERAQRIGAGLTVATAVGTGTQIALIVPGKTIFRSVRASRWSRLRAAWHVAQDTHDPE